MRLAVVLILGVPTFVLGSLSGSLQRPISAQSSELGLEHSASRSESGSRDAFPLSGAAETAASRVAGTRGLSGVAETSIGTRNEAYSITRDRSSSLQPRQPPRARLETTAAETPEAVRPFPDLAVLAYGSAAYVSKTRDTASQSPAGQGAASGHFDVIVTSRLSERFSALAQLGVASEESLEADNSFATEFRTEQLEIKYEASRAFALRLGQLHTPLGYWNQTFHNIRWLRPTIFRPEILRLEGDGGLLPLRSVGVSAAGATSGRWRLGYELSLVNSRRASVVEAVSVSDLSDAEGVDLALTLGFRGRESWRTLGRRASSDLQLGVYGHFESIPTDDRRPSIEPTDLDERVLGGFFAWTPRLIHVIAEYHEIRHRDSVRDRDFESKGWFLQWSTPFGDRWRLYQRVDSVDLANDDPYFLAIDRRDVDKFTTGVRFEPRPFVALRLEVAQTELEGGASSGFGDVLQFNSVAFETAFRLDGFWGR